MSADNLIHDVTEFQSYYHKKDKNDVNIYNGLDDWTMGEIKDTRLYALVPDALIQDYLSGERTPKFLFDQATFDRYVDAETGAFDSKELSRAVQVEPYQNQLMKTQGYAEYRTTILVIDRKGDLELPVGYCQANDQFGPGGAHQCFISEEKMKECQADGTLQYNLAESLRKTGLNERITASEYKVITDAVKSRIDSCERKIAEMQKTDPGFTGPEHPDPAVCDHPFPRTPSLSGKPFQSEDPKRQFTMKEYQAAIEKLKDQRKNEPVAGSAAVKSRSRRIEKADL